MNFFMINSQMPLRNILHNIIKIGIYYLDDVIEGGRFWVAFICILETFRGKFEIKNGFVASYDDL